MDLKHSPYSGVHYRLPLTVLVGDGSRWVGLFGDGAGGVRVVDGADLDWIVITLQTACARKAKLEGRSRGLIWKRVQMPFPLKKGDTFSF